MLKVLIRLDRATHGSLQAKLREQVSEAISRGDFEPGAVLPSTRDLAQAALDPRLREAMGAR